jgi:hypothetical protein
MRQELTDRLTENFPLLYPRNFEFENGDGWFDIIWYLSETLDQLYAAEFSKNKDQDDSDYEWSPGAFPVVAQVKEKFATMRFYVHWGTDEIYAAISSAEHKTHKTCEDCGDVGTLRHGSWISTRCDKCQAEYLKRQEEIWSRINREIGNS